ncbi:MAG TPA: SRPBCC family protein [Paenibacillus sp.]
MLAVIQRVENGYIACFERHLKHSVEKVWSSLTENDQLEKWFSELRVDDLREGEIIKFNMQDDIFEELEIIELKMCSVLEYTWGEDRVRFELYPEPNGCRLVLIEKINKITDHTSKDLAGWHVCLEVISKLLEGRTLDSRDSEWKRWYEQYVQLIKKFPENS